jgi:hypothetical protein
VKYVLIILLGGLVLGGIGAGAYLVYSDRMEKKSSSISQALVPTPTNAPQLADWDDPAGFTMKYPKEVTLNKHDEDKINYAHIELTNSSHPGGLIVWVTDLPRGVTDTVLWGKKMATPSTALSFDTTLGGQQAKKILNSGPPKTATVGVVYDGVLWYIEALIGSEPYWQSVFDSVTGSFTFKPLPTSAAGGAGAAIDTSVSDYSADEEEILE